MAGIVKHARLESPTARARLKRGRQGHWQALIEGKTHLGYQCWKGDPQGRWLVRSYIGNGRYRVEALGRADDGDTEADGARTLSYEQAYAKAGTMVALPGNKKKGQLTVADAWAAYIAAKRNNGQPVAEATSAYNTHIAPMLGDLVVAKLGRKRLKTWHAALAHSRPQLRSTQGKPKYRQAPATDEERRARRASANRVLTLLKAILNHAADEADDDEDINREAWGRGLKSFKNANAARQRFLTLEEVRRLVNACTPDFRPLVQAALETGCRYGELTRLTVADFNPDAGTVHISKSKTGKPRDVYLSDNGVAFFQRHCLGRGGHELMFSHHDSSAWGKSDQGDPMTAAVERAKITPRITFHGTRHTWASHAVMSGMPLMVVARNLGHTDTRMVEKHYGHLAPNYISDAFRKGAPDYGFADDNTVVPLTRTGT
jgi:integrase